MLNGLSPRWFAIGLAVLLGAMALAYAASTAADPATAATAATAAVAKGDRDCDDFRTQKKAQKFFKRHNPRRDPHYLDADNDRIACEENPCPCARKWHRQHGRLHARRIARA